MAEIIILNNYANVSKVNDLMVKPQINNAGSILL